MRTTLLATSRRRAEHDLLEAPLEGAAPRPPRPPRRSPGPAAALIPSLIITLLTWPGDLPPDPDLDPIELSGLPASRDASAPQTPTAAAAVLGSPVAPPAGARVVAGAGHPCRIAPLPVQSPWPAAVSHQSAAGKDAARSGGATTAPGAFHPPVASAGPTAAGGCLPP